MKIVLISHYLVTNKPKSYVVELSDLSIKIK